MSTCELTALIRCINLKQSQKQKNLILRPQSVQKALKSMQHVPTVEKYTPRAIEGVPPTNNTKNNYLNLT